MGTKRALIFPGQGAQKQGMGKELYDNFSLAKDCFERANEILGWRISDTMFYGTESELLETRNTQPAVFLYSTILAMCQEEVKPDVVAGHSLGEFSALVISGAISFESGLDLVLNRALIAQKVCEGQSTAMGAVIGLSDVQVQAGLDQINNETIEKVYFANHNGPGQAVITGTKAGIRLACKLFKKLGAKRAVPLPIAGSFHSPFMKEAEMELGEVIKRTEFKTPIIPIYQCVNSASNTNPNLIRENLITHITSPVNWTQMVNSMVADGIEEFFESGTDQTLQKIVKRMYPELIVRSVWDLPKFQNINQHYLAQIL